MTSSSRRLVPGGRPRRPGLACGAATLIGRFPSPVQDLALLACLYSAHCDEYKPYRCREGATMADAATAELTEETAVTGPADDLAGDLAEDVLVEEVSIDGMCGVY